MSRLDQQNARRPVRAWFFGLLLGIVAGAASIYVLAHPPVDGILAGTISPSTN